MQEPCTVTSVCGQRFIAAGTSDQELTIEGIPGNALGAYLNGGTVTVERVPGDRRFDGPGEGSALIFYPGGKVEAEAYAPLLFSLAEGGEDCELVELLGHFQFLSHEWLS